MANDFQRRACTFQLLRYVPDAVRNEYVHIGVLLREAEPESGSGSESGGGRTEIRFTRDWRRVRCLDPDADVGVLEGMETEFRRRLGEGADERLRKILDESLSLNVQMTEPKAYLAQSLAAGMEELMRLYVEPPPREKQARLRGRAAVQAQMRREFERAQVWDLMRKQIPGGAVYAARRSAADRRGIPAQRDHQDVPRGEPGAGVEMAKVLAFSAAGLRAGVERVEKAELELTAIVEPAARMGATDEEPERLEQYRFAVETMEEHAIRVLTTERLPLVAETARRELRVG